MQQTIMVVEDSPDICHIIKMFFEDEGYSVISSQNSTIIYNLLELDEAGQTLPDIILLDVRIGEEHGEELCLQLKKSPKTQNIPIVLMSGLSNIEEIVQSCNADGYVEKPFDGNDLISMVARLIADKKKHK